MVVEPDDEEEPQPSVRSRGHPSTHLGMNGMTATISDDTLLPAADMKKHRLKSRFQVVKKLGQGTYGKVQLAINKLTGQEVSHPQLSHRSLYRLGYVRIPLPNKLPVACLFKFASLLCYSS